MDMSRCKCRKVRKSLEESNFEVEVLIIGCIFGCGEVEKAHLSFLSGQG
jgi:4-hydroxy-3-methylbut-2-en-1-yl diphosphate synthase IspG/GcpE